MPLATIWVMVGAYGSAPLLVAAERRSFNSAGMRTPKCCAGLVMPPSTTELSFGQQCDIVLDTFYVRGVVLLIDRTPRLTYWRYR